ncbi:hypothetical protein KM043_008580 [Ampulex compressa]|nr:hypothetical protein KM043_008580 [Ampulex compressa]
MDLSALLGPHFSAMEETRSGTSELRNYNVPPVRKKNTAACLSSYTNHDVGTRPRYESGQNSKRTCTAIESSVNEDERKSAMATPRASPPPGSRSRTRMISIYATREAARDSTTAWDTRISGHCRAPGIDTHASRSRNARLSHEF